VGFSTGGLYSLEFIVRIGSINQNVDPSVARCRGQSSAVFYSATFPATSLRYGVRSSLLAARNRIPYRPIISLLITQQRRFASSFMLNPHRQRLLPLPAL
jgi:hypothetical protein